MSETRTVHDPFIGGYVEISNRLVDRLRGKYASGPHLPNGNPEFGWRQFQSPPIQHEAAERIENLEDEISSLRSALSKKDEEIAELRDRITDMAQASLNEYSSARSEIARLREALDWVSEVHPRRTNWDGAEVVLDWDSWNELRAALGLYPQPMPPPLRGGSE